MSLTKGYRSEEGSLEGYLNKLIVETSPIDNIFSIHKPIMLGTNAFFGLEAHLQTPIETLAIALLSKLFTNYRLLVVDSFQLMGAKTQEEKDYVNRSVGKLEGELEVFSKAFGLDFEVVRCSQFFSSSEYNELFEATKAAIMSSPELVELAQKTIPAGVEDKTDISFTAHEVATTFYMRMYKKTLFKVGQGREKLYDEITSKIDFGVEVMFAYMMPFYALGIPPKEITPYNPKSGVKDGGKRIIIGGKNFSGLYDDISHALLSGPYAAQVSLAHLALAACEAGLKAGTVRMDDAQRASAPPSGKIGEQLLTGVFQGIIRAYEIAKLDGRLSRFSG
ncbi:IPT/TIG domain-containing protein [Candidatus Woesearchaeota archaeon]|nr:IPT/TIG domain-containing protein [Candidatus Woesearchaeota archaeon]